MGQGNLLLRPGSYRIADHTHRSIFANDRCSVFKQDFVNRFRPPFAHGFTVVYLHKVVVFGRFYSHLESSALYKLAASVISVWQLPETAVGSLQ